MGCCSIRAVRNVNRPSQRPLTDRGHFRHVTIRWLPGVRRSDGQGAITSTGANAVTLCGAKLSGGPTITGTTGQVNIGGAAWANKGITTSGSVSITHNTGGVTFSNNTVKGSVTITNNSGGFTYASNTLTGIATLSNNT